MFKVSQLYSIPQFLRVFKHIQRKVNPWILFALIRQKVPFAALNIVKEKLT